MFYIPAFNGSNSEHGGMNSIGLISINGIIAGQKMALMRTFFRHPSYTCLIRINLIRHASWRWVEHRRKKRGDGISYSGHKHQKGEKELTITDNQGFIIAPIILKPVNQHDTTILPEAFTELIAFAHRIGMDLDGSALTSIRGLTPRRIISLSKNMD